MDAPFRLHSIKADAVKVRVRTDTCARQREIELCGAIQCKFALPAGSPAGAKKLCLRAW